MTSSTSPVDRVAGLGHWCRGALYAALVLAAGCTTDEPTEVGSVSTPISSPATTQRPAPTSPATTSKPSTTVPATSSTTEATATSTLPATATSSPQDHPETLAPDDEMFGLRWTTDLGGEVVNTQSEGSTLYAAVNGDRGFEIAALDLQNGEVRWIVTVSERGEFSPDFSLGTTSDGVMTSFLDDEGGHVVLLDGASGDEVWDIPLDYYAYELDGEVVDGVGALSPDEGSSMIVDLRTGEELEGLDIMFAIDGRGAVQDGSVLRVDLDPLDPATGGHEIDLGSDAAVLGVAPFDDTLLVLNEAGKLSGYVDDQQRWTLDLGSMQVDDVGLWQDVLVVTEDASNGKPTVDQKWHYFAIDGAQPTPIAGVRDRFDPQGAGLVDGVATIVGRVDETPDMDSDDEVEQVLVIAFESGSAATVDELEVSAFGTVAVLGDHVLIGDRDDGVLQVYTLDGLEETASVTVPPPEPFETGGSFSINEDYLLVIDGSQILNYR